MDEIINKLYKKWLKTLEGKKFLKNKENNNKFSNFSSLSWANEEKNIIKATVDIDFFGKSQPYSFSEKEHPEIWKELISLKHGHILEYSPHIPNEDILWKILRKERDERISSTQWILLRAISRNEETPQEWLDYWQELRDLPEKTQNPNYITWPKIPNTNL